MTRNEFIKRVGYLKRYAPNGMDHYAPAYKHVQIENKAVIAGLKKFYNDHINTNPEILFNVRLATFIPTNLAGKLFDSSPSQEEIEKVRNKIASLRKDNLSKGGEFDPSNLAYKYLRRKGIVDKLKKLKNKLMDKELTLQ